MATVTVRVRLAAAALAAIVLASGAPPAGAARPAEVRFRWLEGFEAPGTPPALNRVGVLEVGPRGARNVLVLIPGTSASAAYFAPLAKTIVERARGWQVWAVERRENQLEDHSVLDRGKTGAAGGQEVFDYYLPIQRFAEMFAGMGLQGLDGTAWYHPLRLTIDAGAVAAGNANPAQDVLAVRATHGGDLPRRLRLYAFGAALGGQRVLDAASALASQSGIPASRLTLVERSATYAHNDPLSAHPRNDFVDTLVPFLARVRRGGR